MGNVTGPVYGVGDGGEIKKQLSEPLPYILYGAG